MGDESAFQFEAAQKVDCNQSRLEVSCELAIDSAVGKHGNERRDLFRRDYIKANYVYQEEAP